VEGPDRAGGVIFSLGDVQGIRRNNLPIGLATAHILPRSISCLRKSSTLLVGGTCDRRDPFMVSMCQATPRQRMQGASTDLCIGRFCPLSVKAMTDVGVTEISIAAVIFAEVTTVAQSLGRDGQGSSQLMGVFIRFRMRIGGRDTADAVPNKLGSRETSHVALPVRFRAARARWPDRIPQHPRTVCSHR
jgi:hypothetical protein